MSAGMTSNGVRCLDKILMIVLRLHRTRRPDPLWSVVFDVLQRLAWIVFYIYCSIARRGDLACKDDASPVMDSAPTERTVVRMKYLT